MSLVTAIWSMIASACLTLAAIYWLVWFRNRTAWAYLLFSVTAASTAAFAFCELWMMRAQTPAELDAAIRWAQLPLFFWIVSITWLVWTYLGAGRRWLAWTISGMRALYLLATLVAGQKVNYREVTSLRHMQLLGESVNTLGGVPSYWTLFGQFAVLLTLAFVVDASVIAWRRGDHRKAATVGGSVVFFFLAGLATSSVAFWGIVQAPLVVSWCYLGLVMVMGYELSRDLLRASQLVHELQASEAGLRESEARVSLAVDAADVGMWIRDLARDEIWASEKWRELFGFAPSEQLAFHAILKRLHPDDREGLHQAHAMAVAGSNERRYQAEYRLVLPDGATRWISSSGRVECDATGRPALIRGASHDVTARKRAELDVRSLSGRLLSAQEEERRRIARELHDNLSQQMAVLTIKIGQVANKLGEPPAPVAGSMREVGRLAVEISTEIHNLSHRLHSSKLDILGLVDALRGHCQELLAQGIRAHFHEDHVPRSLPHDVELCLFRIVQEALNNVVKHSGASEAQVTLRGTGDGLVLSVADFGRGFDEAGAAVRGGLGLASMRERLRLIEGEFTVRSEPGQGTTIIARVPIALGGKMAADTVCVA